MTKVKVNYRATKRFAGGPTDYSVEFTKDGGITVYNDRYPNKAPSITFKVGDTAEYDSYNLHYLGKITKITDTTVTIEKNYYHGQTKRLWLSEFCSRNWDFDFNKIADENFATSQTI